VFVEEEIESLAIQTPGVLISLVFNLSTLFVSFPYNYVSSQVEISNYEKD
jgi:hypothetical protein